MVLHGSVKQIQHKQVKITVWFSLANNFSSSLFLSLYTDLIIWLHYSSRPILFALLQGATLFLLKDNIKFSAVVKGVVTISGQLPLFG